jgi:type II secretory pathway predicted ATPase ExeA
MYSDFYGFIKEPFQAALDLEFFFLSHNLNEILGATGHCIRWRKGLITITGEAGVGKTMLLAYHKKLAANEGKSIYLTNPRVGFEAILELMLKELGVEPVGGLTGKRDQLHALLLAEFRNNRTVVLVIDDAQDISSETLESFGIFSTFEASQQKLLQIILVGRPELNALLDSQELRQVRERIALRACIPPLTKLEGLAYIQHRLKIVSRRPGTVFSKRALDCLVKAAKGNPRRLNTLCEAALATGFGYQQSVISDKIAKEVIADLRGRPSPFMWRIQPRQAVIMVSIALPIIFYSTDLLHTTGHRETTPVQSMVAEPPAQVVTTETPPQSAVSESEAKSQANEISISHRMELNETARLLAVLLDSGRVVVGKAQATINNPRVEDKGFSSSVFEGQLRKEFLARTRHDLHNLAVAPMPETAKPLLLRLAFFMQKAVHEAQPLINKRGIGFKGFIPATFGTQVAELFSKDTGLKLRQIGPPGVAPRNPNNKPDEQEEQLLHAIQRNHPRVGDHMIEHPDTSAVHVLLPLFYTRQCLGCHGSPKGGVDISGYEKEGFKDGDLGGAISITLPFPKKVAGGNQ